MGRKGDLICGVGVNDADYNVYYRVNGKWVSCKYYRIWHSMLVRCYSLKQQQRKPTYTGCSVDEKWHLFSNFKQWMEQQDWEGKCLDKDILVPNNKVYSEDKCMFVSSGVNSFFANNYKNSTGLPAGVSYHPSSPKYQIKAKGAYLGLYNTPEEASIAYQKHKKILLRELISEQTDPKLIQALEQYLPEDVII